MGSLPPSYNAELVMMHVTMHQVTGKVCVCFVGKLATVQTG